jgi:hypothetical protein
MASVSTTETDGSNLMYRFTTRRFIQQIVAHSRIPVEISDLHVLPAKSRNRFEL